MRKPSEASQICKKQQMTTFGDAKKQNTANEEEENKARKCEKGKNSGK